MSRYEKTIETVLEALEAKQVTYSETRPEWQAYEDMKDAINELAQLGQGA